MLRPISAGDRCYVIGGLDGPNSPNIGLVVTVLQRVFECPQLGFIWRCDAAYAVVRRHGSNGCPPGCGDFAQAWLRRIEPDERPVEAQKLEVSA